MPVRIRKLPGKRKFRVTNAGKVTAKGTTKVKAEKQARLLRGLEHGMVKRGAKK